MDTLSKDDQMFVADFKRQGPEKVAELLRTYDPHTVYCIKQTAQRLSTAGEPVGPQLLSLLPS